MNSTEKKPRLPTAVKVIYLLAALSLLLWLILPHAPALADGLNGTVSMALRVLLATLTGLLPFSLAELLLLLLPLAAVLLCVYGARRWCASWRHLFVFAGCVLSSLAVVLSLFVWCFAPGYHTPTLDEKLSLEREPVGAEELFATAELLREELLTLEPQILYLESGASVMPYSLDGMNALLLDAYERVEERYGLPASFPSRVKPVMLSEPMSYTHVTGVYTFFTGEANVNVCFPDYTLPFTAAHELAHQRGIAREDEANFIAYLVCTASEDVYLRYSGTLNLYEYVVSALARADRESYRASWNALPEGVKGEERAYAEFFERYRESVAASVSQATNDAYLKGQGAEAGTKSYGMVVDLAVALLGKQTD